MGNVTIKGQSVTRLKKCIEHIATYHHARINVGVFTVKDDEGKSIAQKMAMLEFGGSYKKGASIVTIPARAPFRTTIKKKKKVWVTTFRTSLAQALQSGNINIQNALRTIGDVMVNDIKASFDEGLQPELTISTIQEKRKLAEHAELAGVRTGQTKDAITVEYVKL